MTTLTPALGALAVTHPGWQEADGPGWWILVPIGWFLIVGGAIIAAVVLRRRWHRQAGLRAGEAVLAEQFARGEIDETDFTGRLETLRRAAS